MNEKSHTETGSGSQASAPPGAATTENAPADPGFFGWVRGLGISRSSEERWLSGVAGGIAAKAGIDPLIVRGLFVVLTLLSAPGILIYFICWILLPDSEGRIHLEEIIRGRATTTVTLLSVLFTVLIVLPLIFGVSLTPWTSAGWGFAGDFEWVRITLTVLFWAVAVPAGIVWLIIWSGKRGRASRAGSTPPPADPTNTGSPTAAPTAFTEKTTAYPTPTDAPSDQPPSFGERVDELGERLGRTANEWGEGIGRKTEEWSERYEAEHAARALGVGPAFIIIALALLTAGITLLWAMNAGLTPASAVISDSGLPYVLALAAGVAALSVAMIVIGALGRNSGWVGFLALCGVVALFFTAVLPGATRVQPFGNLHLDETNGGRSLVLAGNTTIDLTDLDAQDAGAEVVVWQVFGNSTIDLPEDHAVRVNVVMLAGNIDEQDSQDREQRGVFLGRSFNANGAGSASTPAADTSTVTVRLLAGNVYINGDYELERAR